MKAGYFLLGLLLAVASAYSDPIGLTARAIMNTAYDPNGNPAGLKVDRDGKVIAHCE